MHSIRLLLVLLIALPAIGNARSVPEAPPLEADAYILMDAATGQVIAEHDADQRRSPASITKVMTSYVAFEEIAAGRAAMDDEVLISEKAWRQGIDSSQSRMFIEVGSRVPLEALLHGMIVQSGNDASVAIAEHLAGSEAGFASMMNATAKRLGMTNSRFQNASGMPVEQHYSTARDIAKLIHAHIKDFPDGYAIYSEKEFTYNEIRQFNRNRLLWRDDTVDGVKTGYTSESGYCLASSAVRDGRRLISVVLGTPSPSQRTQDSLALLNYGYRFFDTVTLFGAGEEVQKRPIYGGAQPEIAIGVAEALSVTVPRDAADAIKLDAEIRSPLRAPIAAGERLGTLTVTLDDETLLVEPLVATGDVPEGGIFKRLFDAVRLRLGV
ncbi:D-alanyl-D-alanine carboxypeptidase family protein [Algiphilus sp.]|uniref:D-alanyl-D-alanine carboxypeptidase family protein n=1 Tax=Algiphilus sp. TaxID=1872431 RepID=UPI0025BA0461|nr:D-alanyl-D-alanine carboxypeptidase family protein [Algiphilus sp.]MCK5769275.1 D-alanyl-D-alanine carboxypeptidase [Algiphilus sp.]